MRNLPQYDRGPEFDREQRLKQEIMAELHRQKSIEDHEGFQGLLVAVSVLGVISFIMALISGQFVIAAILVVCVIILMGLWRANRWPR